MKMTVTFTVEEMTALKEANQPSRTAAIVFFTQGLPFYGEDEKELMGFTNALIDKLKAMTDTQYEGLDFDTAIDTTEPDDEV